MIRRFLDWLRAYQCSMCGALTHDGVIRGHDPKTERPIFVCNWCGAAVCRGRLGEHRADTDARLQRANEELQGGRRRLKDVEAKLAAAEADTPRLDWLIINGASVAVNTDGDEYWVWIPEEPRRKFPRARSPRAAIDAAKTEVKAKHPEGLCGHIGCDCYEDAAKKSAGGDTAPSPASEVAQ